MTPKAVLGALRAVKPQRSAPIVGWVVVALVGGFAAAMAGITIDRHNPDAGPANIQSLWRYWLCFGALWAGLTVLVWRLSRLRTTHGQPWERGVAGVVLGVALAGRVTTVVMSGPQLSDDLWRYIHDGRQLAAGINPYERTPTELGAGRGVDPILDRINHPELVTIYQPTSQYVFAVLWWVHPAGWDPLGDVTFRLGFVVFDLLVVGLLLGVLRRQGRSAWWAALYAWHPLVIGEVAGSGHQDVIGIALMLGGLTCVAWGRSGVSSKPMAIAGGLLAAAAAVKPIVLLLVGPMAWRLWRGGHGRSLVWAGVVPLIVGVGLYLPFVTLGSGMGRLFETASAFVSGWSFNGSCHGLLAYATGSKILADWAAAGLLLLLVVWRAGFKEREPWRMATALLFASLLVSSTVHPWYLLWALALVPLGFNPGVWVFSLTISWSYAVLGNLETWRLPLWVSCVEYLPVYAAVIGQVVWRKKAP